MDFRREKKGRRSIKLEDVISHPDEERTIFSPETFLTPEVQASILSAQRKLQTIPLPSIAHAIYIEMSAEIKRIMPQPLTELTDDQVQAERQIKIDIARFAASLQKRERAGRDIFDGENYGQIHTFRELVFCDPIEARKYFDPLSDSIMGVIEVQLKKGSIGIGYGLDLALGLFLAVPRQREKIKTLLHKTLPQLLDCFEQNGHWDSLSILLLINPELKKSVAPPTEIIKRLTDNVTGCLERLPELKFSEISNVWEELLDSTFILAVFNAKEALLQDDGTIKYTFPSPQVTHRPNLPDRSAIT